MAQRLALNIKEGGTSLGEVENFVELANKYGIKSSEKLDSVAQEADGSVILLLSLPDNIRVVNGEAIKIKEKSKKKTSVEDHIEGHKSKKNKEGYVPPAGRTTPPPKQKSVCPECGVKKPVGTKGKTRYIKKHKSHGVECPGSGCKIMKVKKPKVMRNKPEPTIVDTEPEVVPELPKRLHRKELELHNLKELFEVAATRFDLHPRKKTTKPVLIDMILKEQRGNSQRKLGGKNGGDQGTSSEG